MGFDLRVGMNDFENNLADALIGYLGLTEEEKLESRATVRRNSVKSLSWTALADQIVTLAGDEAQDHSGSLR